MTATAAMAEVVMAVVMAVVAPSDARVERSPSSIAQVDANRVLRPISVRMDNRRPVGEAVCLGPCGRAWIRSRQGWPST